MNLVKIDNRHPVTRALAYGLQSGKISPADEKMLKSQMENLVVECAKKFVGFKNVESIKQALEILLGILSLSVQHTSPKKEDLETWLNHILTLGLPGVAKESINMVKIVTSLPTDSRFEDITIVSASDQLIKFATKFSDKGDRRWIGYKEYSHMVTNQSESEISKKLAIFLIKKFTGMSLAQWKHSLESNLEFSISFPTGDEIVNTFLFRHCLRLSLKGDITILRSQLHKAWQDYSTNPKKWTQGCKKRYESLLREIPDELLSGLVFLQKDWFVIHMQDGPPNVPKNWTIGDSIPSVTGVYMYQME